MTSTPGPTTPDGGDNESEAHVAPAAAEASANDTQETLKDSPPDTEQESQLSVVEVAVPPTPTPMDTELRKDEVTIGTGGAFSAILADPEPEEASTVSNHGGNDADDYLVEEAGTAQPVADSIPAVEGDIPRLHGREITFRTAILHPFLICPLCGGYLRDATTINECLHTFCQPCISQHLRMRDNCPQCRVHLGVHPHETLRHDLTMQGMVERLFPELALPPRQHEPPPPPKTNLKRPREPEAFRPRRSDAAPAKERLSSPPRKKVMRVPREEAHAAKHDWTGVNLAHDDSNGSDLQQLDKPHLQTSRKMPVQTLKAYLQRTLKLRAPDELEVLCNGELLPAATTLGEAEQRWQLPPPMVLHYRRVRQ